MTSTLVSRRSAEGEQQFSIRRVQWEQYVTINDAFPNRRGLRMIYGDGNLTFVTKSHRHEWFAECLGHFVLAVASECGLDWETAGGTTFRRRDLEAGVEGDKTFYFGANAEKVRGPVEIDLDTQPPPDLAVEVEVTHRADAAMIVWGKLGVPEVWRFDADRRLLSIWHRSADATYAEVDRSRFLPMLEPSEILNQIVLAEELGSSSWYVQLHEWIREVVVPRMG